MQVDVCYDEVICETELAINFLFDDKTIWIPKKLLLEIDVNEQIITIQEDIAIGKNLDMYII